MILKILAFLIALTSNQGAQTDEERSAPPASPEIAASVHANVAKQAAKKATKQAVTRAPQAPSPSLAVAAPADLPSVPVTVAAQVANPADVIVDKVQAFYRGTKQLSAKFRQTTMNNTFGIPKTNDGRLYLKKPGKMRWDYYSKRNTKQVVKTQLSDGDKLWVVDMNGKWYYTQSLADSTLPVAVSFLSGTGDLKADFNAKLDTTGRYGAKGDKVVLLTPKKPSAQFKQLILVVDPSNYRVKHSIVINAAGDTNQFSFYEPNTTRAVADTWFVFNPKAPATKSFRQIQPEDAAK